MEICVNNDASPSESKRKRASNWSEEDKMLLKQLVKERVSVIENKNTDTNTNKKKKKAWMELEESFNNMCNGSKRSLAQLRSQWIVTKIQARKEVSNHRKEMNKTGGGPQPAQLEMCEDDIAAWLPNEFVVDTNQFDSDGLFEISLPETQIETTKLAESPPATKTSPTAVHVVSDDANIVQVEGAVLQNQKKKMKQKINQDVADEKIKEVVNFDLQCREELHRLQVLNEEKRSRNLDLEYKILEEKYKALIENTQSSKKKL